jgi:hypothetical protein
LVCASGGQQFGHPRYNTGTVPLRHEVHPAGAIGPTTPKGGMATLTIGAPALTSPAGTSPQAPDINISEINAACMRTSVLQSSEFHYINCCGGFN